MNPKGNIYELYKINVNEHPIIKETYKTRYNYFLILYLAINMYQKMKKEEEKFLKLYKDKLGITEQDYKEIIEFYKLKDHQKINEKLKRLRKYKFEIKWLSLKIKNYKYILLADVIYFNLMSDSIQVRDLFISMIKRGLKIKEEDYIKILRFLKNIAQNNLKKAKIEFEENLSSWRFELLTYFYKKVINDLEEIKKEIKRIPIVATMSAGKSTLINALVGIDLLPTKNQVCTSKIMEITHNPNLDYFVAYAERKDGEKLSIPLLNQKIIQKWNQDNDIEFIYLEGDVKILDASNKKIKLIDTPGVNSFKYQEHSKLTEEVLRRKDFENLVYVLNATQLTTTDDQSFLNKVVDIYKKRNINPNDIIFVLNKLDKFDLEAGEDIEETIKEAKDHLDNCGIKKAKIIPISAYAAFLFSKSLIEQSLSKKESLDFSFFYSIFAKEEYNLNAYFEQKSIKNNQIKSDGEINVAGNRFSKKNIFSRIDKTGILNLKNIIN